MNPATTRHSQAFVFEGVVRELHVEEGRENLLRKVLQHYQGQGVATGLAGVAGDLFGQIANSAMLAMYDGESSENFLCLVDGQVVCGTFGGVSRLENGDRIKAVVSRQGEVLVARALLSQDKGFLWVSHPCGTKAERLSNLKIGFWATCFCMAMVVLGDLVAGPFVKELGRFAFYGWMALSAAVVCIVVGTWVNSDMKAASRPTTETFRLLGFVNPESVDLTKYNYKLVHYKELFASSATEFQQNYKDLYLYQKAATDGKLEIAM